MTFEVRDALGEVLVCSRNVEDAKHLCDVMVRGLVVVRMPDGEPMTVPPTAYRKKRVNW